MSLSTVLDPSIRCASNWDHLRPEKTDKNVSSGWWELLLLCWHCKGHHIQLKLCCWEVARKRIVGTYKGQLWVVFNDYIIFMISSQNVFSDKLSPLGFNHFQMFVVDLMHEFKLGVWKSLFTHLLHILDAYNNHLLDELDCQWEWSLASLKHADISNPFPFSGSYWQMPTFGSNTIQKCPTNVPELKKLAAHNIEDLLQVGLPQGLL